MQAKFFLTMLGAGALALIDTSAEAQTKKHVKIIEIVDGDTTITEKTVDSKSTSSTSKSKDNESLTFAYSYSSDEGKSSPKKATTKSSNNETTQISIDMDDRNAGNFKKVILRNDNEKKNVFRLEVETGKDLPFEIEVKDESDKAVFTKQVKSGKKIDESINLDKQKKGSYVLTVKQGKETVANNTITID